MATAVAGGTMLLGANSANASTKIDDYHVQVVAGDTLSKIAEENNTTVDQLVKDNHIANKDLIHVGDKLVIVPGANDQTAQENSTVVNASNKQANSNQSQTVQPLQQSNNAVATTNTASATSANLSGNSAADSIAQAESGGSYTATNGRYYGKYQLDISYLGGDLSPQHQEEVFQNYVNQRYGGVNQALAFRQAHGWY